MLQQETGDKLENLEGQVSALERENENLRNAVGWCGLSEIEGEAESRADHCERRRRNGEGRESSKQATSS